MLEEHGKAHLIKNCIEKRTLKPSKALATRHDGEDLEGNYVRNLMENGDDIFGKARTCLSEENRNNCVGNTNDLMTKEEAKKVSFFNTRACLKPIIRLFLIVEACSSY